MVHYIGIQLRFRHPCFRIPSCLDALYWAHVFFVKVFYLNLRFPFPLLSRDLGGEKGAGFPLSPAPRQQGRGSSSPPSAASAVVAWSEEVGTPVLRLGGVDRVRVWVHGIGAEVVTAAAFRISLPRLRSHLDGGVCGFVFG